MQKSNLKPSDKKAVLKKALAPMLKLTPKERPTLKLTPKPTLKLTPRPRPMLRDMMV